MSDTSDRVLLKAKRLEKRLRQCAVLQKDLAVQLGCTPQTINKLVKGTQNLSRAWARRLSPFLETTPEYLLFETDCPDQEINAGDGNTPQTVTKTCVPIVTLSTPAGAGGGKIIESEPSTWGKPEYFDDVLITGRLRASPADMCAVTIEGQSMEPVLQNGDSVLVNRTKNSVLEPGIFVLHDGDGVVCKWVERIVGSEPAMYRVKSENPRFSDYTILADQTQILGRVVWFGRIL